MNKIAMVVTGLALGVFASAAMAQQYTDPYGLNARAQAQQQQIQQSRAYYRQQADAQAERERAMANQLLMQNMPQYQQRQPYQTGSQLGEQAVQQYNAAHTQRVCYVAINGQVICQ